MTEATQGQGDDPAARLASATRLVELAHASARPWYRL